MKITQSFLKDFKSYLAGELCGNLVHHCWILGKLLPPSAAMHVGTYFEFCLTGAMPKEGKVPMPKYNKDGTMASAYRKAKNDAAYVKAVMKEMGLKIISVGAKLAHGRFEGTLDIIAEATRELVIDNVTINAGEQIIIDMKYSGLLEDKWSIHGWAMTDYQKAYKKIQAVHYHMIGKKMKFFYWVVDSSHAEKDEDGVAQEPAMKVFYIPIDQEMIDQHISEGNYLFEKFEDEKLFGFNPRPVFNKCNKCALREGCADRMRFPNIETVNVNTD